MKRDARKNRVGRFLGAFFLMDKSLRLCRFDAWRASVSANKCLGIRCILSAYARGYRRSWHFSRSALAKSRVPGIIRLGWNEGWNEQQFTRVMGDARKGKSSQSEQGSFDGMGIRSLFSAAICVVYFDNALGHPK